MTSPGWQGLTCIIPAHNEAPRIARVLRAAAGHPLIDRLLVVDDGSTDGTADLAATFPGVELLRLSPNRGKTAALAAGIARATTPHLMFLDADLTGLIAADLTRLIRPVRDGRARASLSLRGNAPGLWRAIGLDYISGERVVARADLPADLTALPRFGFEVALNRALIARGAPVAVVRWPGVSSPAKALKRGVLPGLAADAGMLADIFRTLGPTGAARQILSLRRLAT